MPQNGGSLACPLRRPSRAPASAPRPPMHSLSRWLPSLPLREWGPRYDRHALSGDLLAAVIVTVMLVPQALAYALLAGLPPAVGLYASMAPLLAYALLGSSRVLAVGPMAVVSLMTASAIGNLAVAGSPAYGAAALVLAFLSGGMLLAMGLLRLGFLANFLSGPVISGFMSSSAVIIAASQLKTLMGVQGGGHNLPEMLQSLARQAPHTHGLTLALGAATIAVLVGLRWGALPLLMRLGLRAAVAGVAARVAPVVVIVASAVLVWALDGPQAGVQRVGPIPGGLPPLTWPAWDPALWRALLLPALLISVIGFVGSVSVAQTLAARRRERIAPDQELVALGAGNIAAAFTGGMPITGSLARSAVNVDAGAHTPAAGLFSALGVGLAALLLTPALFHLPQATLAATIVVAALSLVDLGALRRTWAYSRTDFAALAITALATLGVGVEAGLVAGVGLSLVLHLFRSSRPHIAEVGWVPGTQHFRNIHRHAVRVSPALLSLRVDESLFFANARALEDQINQAVASRQGLRHVVLQCVAINSIDASALESLEAIAQRLRDAGIALHLSEVKGFVMDRLQSTDLVRHLTGEVFLTHYQAVAALTPEVLQAP